MLPSHPSIQVSPPSLISLNSPTQILSLVCAERPNDQQITLKNLRDVSERAHWHSIRSDCLATSRTETKGKRPISCRI